MTPKTMNEQMEEIEKVNKDLKQVEEIVNPFLENWTGSNYPHLIDTDENDGQELRENIIYLIEEARKSQLQTDMLIVEELKEKIKNKLEEEMLNNIGYICQHCTNCIVKIIDEKFKESVGR